VLLPPQGPANPFQTALQDALAQDFGQGAGATPEDTALMLLPGQRQTSAADTGNGLPPASGATVITESVLPPQTVPGPTTLLEVPVLPAMSLATPEARPAAKADAMAGELPQGMTPARVPAGALPIPSAVPAALDELMPSADGAKSLPVSFVPVGDAAKTESFSVLPATVPALSAATASSSASAAAPFSLAAFSSSAPMVEQAAGGVALPVRHARWGEALGERVVWMVGNQNSSAQLSLNPPELGPLEVRISVDRNDAQVTFVSAHGAVRDAVEAALPRLREMLAQAGMNLTDANVSAHAHARDSSAEARAQAGGGPAASGDAQENDSGESRSIARGLVDLYA
jgi:flagellar hook-length control protein FliK